MINTSIIPDRHIIGILPAMSNLQVMIVHNQPHEPFQQRFRFQGSHAVDVVHVLADCEDGFPACDRVCADYRVDGGELIADIMGGAARGGVEFEISFFGGLDEARLCVSGGQRVIELLVRCREAVVELVARSPERVYQGSTVSNAIVGALGEKAIPPPVPGSSTSRRMA